MAQPATPMEGQLAPEFTLPDQDGKPLSLKELRGRPVVLYFYPEDDTPGCTTQACGFRDAFPRFEGVDAVILGVSPDSPESHRAFREKYDLPFTLLADEDHAVASRYGAWGMKNLFGNEFEGILRTTFVIDADGKVAKVFPRVRVEEHAQAVLEAVNALSA